MIPDFEGPALAEPLADFGEASTSGLRLDMSATRSHNDNEHHHKRGRAAMSQKT